MQKEMKLKDIDSTFLDFKVTGADKIKKWSKSLGLNFRLSFFKRLLSIL
jgi:hypothetical protein